MPEVQEVFRMATQKVRPDPEALERQHRHQRRRVVQRKVGAFSVAAAVVALAIVAVVVLSRDAADPGPRPADRPVEAPEAGGVPVAQGEPPTGRSLSGVWVLDDEQAGGWTQLMMSFSPDGTFAIDDGGSLDLQPHARGTYRIDGDTVRFASRGSEGCPEGTTWAVQAGIPEDGRLHLVSAESADLRCSPSVGTESWLTRVSPASSASRAMPAPDLPSVGTGRPETILALRGIWLLEGSGRLLRIAVEAEGTYAIDESGQLVTDPDDTGAVEVEPNGTVIFTSAGSPTCPKGATIVWEDVRMWATSLRATVAADACGGESGIEQTWIRLSYLK
jgi:hypothetical protein